jgi:hypothetical protein
MSGQALTELHMLTNRRRFIKTAGSMGIGALVPFHLVDDQTPDRIPSEPHGLLAYCLLDVRCHIMLG